MSWFPALIAVLSATALAQDVPSSVSEPLPAGVYRIGNGVSVPRLLSPHPEPEYSEEARLANLQSTIQLSFVVGEDGKPRDIHITQSAGLGLDEKAIESVSAWKFMPGTKDGKPVAVLQPMECNFRTSNKSPWHLARAVFHPPNNASRPVIIKAEYSQYDEPSESAEGAISLAFDVDESGVPINFHVQSSSDKKWEHAIIAMVRDWRFQPGIRDGKPVSVPCTFDFSRSVR